MHEPLKKTKILYNEKYKEVQDIGKGGQARIKLVERIGDKVGNTHD